MNRTLQLFFLLLLLVTSSCHRKHEKIEPQINYSIQENYLKTLPSPFPPLTEEERASDWGKEMQVALGFSHQLDLYQAMISFKRAYFLIPDALLERKEQIEYCILLSYYLGKKYDEVIYFFESSRLRTASRSFPAFHDLMVILYDSYLQMGESEKAQQMQQALANFFPATEKKLALSSALLEANFPLLEQREEPPIQNLLKLYDAEKKSPQQAQVYNALLPGAGYLYLGQKQSALTAFLLNGLFIAAAYHFFDHKQIAAGAITTGFELGWYVGGINGAKEEAKFYNARVYEKYASPIMNQQRLFPVYQLQFAF